MRHSLNPLEQLSRGLIEFYGGWRDAFHPDCEAAKSLEAYSWELGRAASTEPPGPMCLEEFLSGSTWKKVRELAGAALKEVNVEAWPLPDKIDFSDYIEIVDPDERS